MIRSGQRPNPDLDLPAPAGLSAFRFEVEGEEFAVIELPLADPPPPPGLTAAESEVAMLVGRGLSNAEIARHRGTSVRTVANQIAAIFDRLGVRSRAELVARCAAAQQTIRSSK